MRDYITKNYTLSIDFLDYSKNNNTSISIQNKDIVYSEKDTNTAFIEANLFADGKQIDLRGYDKVVVGIKKSDGLRVQNDCIVLNAINGKIEIPFTTQSLASVGVNYFDITLYTNDSELVSPKFSYRVMEAMINDDTLESSNEFGTLVILIEKTEELLNRTNNACDRVEMLEEVVTANELIRNSNEEIRKSNELDRVSSETTRKANESNRVNSETIRKESEITRVNFYNDTVAKENIRVTKEAERVANENTRVTSETDRVNSETTRKSNEVDRVSSEATRKSNETTRVNNEQVRVNNETARELEFDALSTNMINTDTHWNTQFQDRYDNLNQEYAELVDTLDKDISVRNSSETLLNESVASFKVGTGKVNGVAKDYSSQMERSLIIVYDSNNNEVYNGVHNPNDIITLSTAITSTHKVQLNTKSQVEELQEVVQKEKKSVWQKLKELTDVKISLGQQGYIKFPTALGGILFQWGRVNISFNNEQYLGVIASFPIAFSSDIWYQSANMFTNSVESFYFTMNTTYNSLSQSNIRVTSTRGNVTFTPSISWFALGR